MKRIFIDMPEAKRKPGRLPINQKPMTPTERVKKHRAPEKARRERCIAVLDTETDPFDNESETEVLPFLAVLYSDQFEPVVIWDENFPSFKKRVVAAILALPEPYIIYAHNGGRFDFMFFVSELRGEVSFKGRGIMEAKLGPHLLRDSFHIIPERLANIQKDKFQYEKLRKAVRHQYRAETIEYCLHDCKYLFDIVKKFIDTFGIKISIGQAAMYELRKHYDIKKLSDGWDNYLRQYFFGGRVECIRGRGHWRGNWKLYDTNSMYPDAMCRFQHPVGDFFDYELRVGDPNEHTCFIDLACNNNRALIARTEEGETTANIGHGNFYTTIHEYNVAKKYNLISNVEINFCIDCKIRTDFSKFVLPLYSNRQITKAKLRDLKKAGLQNTADFHDVNKDDIFYKLLLNNAYGKLAQNPRRFRQYYLTDHGEMPAGEWMESIEELPAKDRDQYMLPSFESEHYDVWEKPAPGFRFNNVGTAASITGAARATLLEALQHATDPIYCDTDSIICRELKGVEIDKEKLGAWDLEDEFTQVIIDGKKLYSCWFKTPRLDADGQKVEYKIRSKGTAGLTWRDMLAMLAGESVIKKNKAPTFTREGDKGYLSRTIRATAPLLRDKSP